MGAQTRWGEIVSCLQRRRRWCAVLLLLLLIGCGVLSASQPLQAAGREPGPVSPPGVGPQAVAVAAITTGLKDQIRPRAAYHSQVGEYLAVWEYVYSDTDHDIYARRLNSDGIPVANEVGVVTTSSSQMRPDVAAHTTNSEYLVVWEHEYSAADHDIHAWRVTTGGIPTGSELGIASSSYNEGYPAVVYNPVAHEYLVVYERYSGSDEFAQYDIYARRVAPDGSLLGAEIVVANGTRDELRPAVAFGSEYLVVWQGRQSGTTEYGIYGQRIAGNGSLVGGPITISTWEGDQLVPRVAYNSQFNEFLVTWEEHHWGEANGWDVYAQMVNADGTLKGSQIMVSASGTKNRFNPDVTYVPLSRSYMVVWEYEYATWDHDVYGRRVAYDGTQPEEEFVLSNLGSHEKEPLVVAGSMWEQRVLTAWEDYRNYATSLTDLYGAAVTATIPVLSGHVYSGTVGIETAPLAEVRVELYCSSGTGELGTRVATAWTDVSGAYNLAAVGLCEVYHLLETDPERYTSTAAQSPAGTVVNANQIYYTYPLAGKILSGNNFWDYPAGPTDTLPPGNWTGFQPAGWTNAQTADCSVQVEDTISGLDVSTAQYAYSIDGGTSWSAWEAAACTGGSGTTDPQRISASVPFGRDSGPGGTNRVRFRIADQEGNAGESDPYTVSIDTVPPQNPTAVTCPAHPRYTWSNQSQVTCSWSGASDAGSGIDGYTLDWDHVPTTVPALPFETSATEVSLPLGDSSAWYLHVRSVDRAGNGAEGAAHYGAIQIDTSPPTAWLTAPTSGALNTATFDVAWGRSDGLSGVAGCTVQTSLDGTAWNDWQIEPTFLTAPFTGQRGQTHHFRVRARDQAGNVGDWSASRQVTVGVDVTVRVENQVAVPLSGAEVYLNGTGQGVTYGGGTRTLHHVLVGDQLAARYLVDHHIADKGYHDWVYAGSGGWSYRIYLTSVNFDNAGNPQMYTVSNTGTTQVLRVRVDNALVGFYVLVSVEWDADAAFLNQLLTGFRSASEYLFDVTDGQMLFEVIEIRDNQSRWSEADYRVYANNQITPNANVGGIWQGSDQHVYVGRYWSGNSANWGAWTQSDGFRTLVHEFGHYGLDLYDEYQNASGGSQGAGCTTDRATTPAAERASFMDSQYSATEACSGLTLHPHNTNTEQHAQRGGPCWDTIEDRYDDEQSPYRWFVERPDDRGSVMAGPWGIPVSDWVFAGIRMDADTGVCPPFDTEWVHSNGSPAIGFDTWVENGDQLYQGKTVTNTTATAGAITILGAHQGDTIRVQQDCGWFCSHSGSAVVNCAAAASSTTAAPLTVAQDPFGLEVEVTPQGDGSTIAVRVRASTTLAAPPQVQVRQEGADAPVVVSLAYDGAAYAGTAVLDPALGLRGQVWAQATDTSAHTVTTLNAFNAERVAAGADAWLQSVDGRLDLYLPAGSLSGEPVIGIQPGSEAPLAQGSLVVVGSTYRVNVSSGAYDLAHPAVVTIGYEPGLMAGVDVNSLRIYHWDSEAGQWVSDGGTMDIEHHLVSTQVDRLSTFAILAEKTNGVYLPVVMGRR
jgi:hypothetical protein